MYLFYLERQLEIVTIGFKLAPQNGVVRQIAMRMAPAAWVSTSKLTIELQKAKVNRKTAVN